MKIKWRISFLLVLSVLSYLTIESYKNRVYNWDLPAYLGCLYSVEFPDSPKKVHELSYQSIKNEASPAEYYDIAGKIDNHIGMRSFELYYKAFNEQIPYYKIKIGYNVIIYGFYKFGVSAPTSVLLVSIVSYFLSGLLLFYILKEIFPQNYFLTSIFTLVILLLPTARFMSKTPSPDMLGFIFLLAFILGLFKKWNKWIIFSVLMGSVLIRPDYVIFALTYLFTISFYNFIAENKKIDIQLVGQGILFLLVYLFIVKFYHYPGWKNLFYDSFIERRPFISGKLADFTVNDYLRVVFNKFINFKKISLSALIIFTLIFYFSKDLWVRIFSVFLFANIYIKFLFFPDSAAVRFFFGFIVLLFLMLLYVLSKKYNGFQLNKNP